MEEYTDFKKYTKPVYIKVQDVGNIYWDPQADNLMTDYEPGSMEMQDTIVEFIDAVSMAQGSSEIAVTPEGPFLPADPTNIHTLIWAVNYLYEDFKINILGDAPTLKDLGLDKASSVDEDGNQIVR